MILERVREGRSEGGEKEERRRARKRKERGREREKEGALQT